MCTFADEEYLLVVKPKRVKRNLSQKNQSTATQITTCKNESESQTEFDTNRSTQTSLQCDENIDFNSLSASQLSTLRSFLTKIEPVIAKELKETIETQNIFSDYSVKWKHAPSSVHLESKTCFEINDDEDIKNENKISAKAEQEFGGLCIDCNATNNRIAIGFGLQRKHFSWCLHSSHVVIWNTNNIQQYEHCIEIASCCTAIKYHPQYDNILSFGLFNGSISIYELNNDGNTLLNTELASSTIDDCFHKEIITDLCWIKSSDHMHTAYNLISISMDGKLLIWDFNYNSLASPIMGYTLIPTKIYNINALQMSHQISAISITNIAFPYSKYENNSFVVGTQCGTLMKCLMDFNAFEHKYKKNKKYIKDGDIAFDIKAYNFYKNLKNKSNQMLIRRNIEKYMKLNKSIKIIRLKDIFAANNSSDAAQKLYPAIDTKLVFNKAHLGFINNIQFSPFSCNLFLSSSITGYLQIFSVFHTLPIIQLIPENGIFDAKWSPIRACCVAVINKHNELLIYDLLKNQYVPQNKIQISNDKDIKLNKLCFNKSGDKIFICDNCGNLYIYQLSNVLIQHNPKELKHIQQWINLK